MKYWLKIITITTEGRLTKYVYDVQKQYMEEHENKTNWVGLLRGLLCEHGFGEVWYNQGVGNEDVFMEVFKQRLTDMYGQTWCHALEHTRKSI